MTHGPDPVYILRGSESPVTCLKYLSDDTLYSGDQNGSVYTWDIKTKRQSNKISAHSGHSVLWMEFMQNVMVTQGRDGVVQFWNKTEDGWHKSGTSCLVLKIITCLTASKIKDLFINCTNLLFY